MDYGFVRGNNGPYTVGDMQYLSWVEVTIRSEIPTYTSHGVPVDYSAFTMAVNGSPAQNPYWNDLGGSGTSNQSSLNFVRDCAGNSLYQSGHPVWFQLDWSRSAVATAYTNDYITPNVTSGYTVTAYYLDGNTIWSGMHDVVTGAGQKPCIGGINATATTWYNAIQTGLISLGVSVMVDNLGNPMSPYRNQALPNPVINLIQNIYGGRSEDTYACLSAADPGCKNTTTGAGGYAGCCVQPYPVWESEENTEIAMTNAGKHENLVSGDQLTVPTTVDGQKHRMFFLASALLTYSDHIFLWPQAAGCVSGTDPHNTTGECIFPEFGFYPKDPLVPYPANYTGTGNTTGVESLQDPGGAYYREYAHCGYHGTLVGSCIVVVNPNPTVSVPFPHYATWSCGTCVSMVLHNGPGATIPNGGTVTLDGPAAPSTMAPDSAYVIVKP